MLYEIGADINSGWTLINDVRNRPSVMAVNYPLTLTRPGQGGPEKRKAYRTRWRAIQVVRSQPLGYFQQVLSTELRGPGQQPFLDKHVLLPIPTCRERCDPSYGFGCGK